MTANASSLSRRRVLAGSGAARQLLIGSGLPARRRSKVQPISATIQTTKVLAGQFGRCTLSRFWIRIDSDGKVTVFTGKAELGHIKTALCRSL